MEKLHILTSSMLFKISYLNCQCLPYFIFMFCFFPEKIVEFTLHIIHQQKLFPKNSFRLIKKRGGFWSCIILCSCAVSQPRGSNVLILIIIIYFLKQLFLVTKIPLWCFNSFTQWTHYKK